MEKQIISIDRPMPFRVGAFGVVLLLAAVLSFLLFRPFFIPASLALICAGVLRPLHLFYLRLFKKRETLAASMSLITVILVVLVPLTGLLLLLVREGIRFIALAQSNLDVWLAGTLQWLEKVNAKMPFLHIEKINLESLLPRALDQALKFAMSLFNSATQGAAAFLFQSVVFLFCLYYFFIDWERLGRWVDSLSPFESRHNQKLYDHFISMGRAVLKSTLVLGILQGILGGAALAVVGVPSPIFWGMVMILLSLLPVVGSIIVWLPAGVIEILYGNALGGIGLILFGLIVISNIDNLLRPKLVGDDTALHPLAVFLSTLGGLAFFGVSGFILGPVIIALFASFLQIYREELRPLWLSLHSGIQKEPAGAGEEPSLNGGEPEEAADH